MPPEITKGYWSTFRFIWNDAAVEIEVCRDHLEIYRFFNLRTDIKDIPYSPGEPFPESLIAELPGIRT
jgi:hypothetical protein